MAARTRKSNANADREVSQVERLGAENAQLLTLNTHLRQVIVERDAEILRIQALLRITQVKLAKYDRQARINATPRGPSFRERCQAYFKSTGERSVTAPQLQAWEAEHAQG